MNKKKVILITLSVILCFTITVQSLNNVNSSPPLDNIILYLAAENPEPYLGEDVNVTLVFKNLLDVSSNLDNVTLDIDTGSSALNITSMYNIPSDNEINTTDLFVYGTNSTPIFEWNTTHIQAAWAIYEIDMIQSFWFIVNCTEEGTQNFDRPTLTYELDGVEETYEGESFSIDVLVEQNVSSIPVPIRGEWQLYWWFAGSLAIAVPLIVIVITRITLWKR